VSILTSQEAAAMLRLENASDYPQLAILLPAIDEYIKTGTGKDWGTEPVDAVAKMAASILLVQWFENPAMIGTVGENNYGLTNLLTQLHAKALPAAI
jgi:hypothetical protein